jgi:LPXTG-site transpeptidase (sortase) family protein
MRLRIPALGINDVLTGAEARGGVLYAPPDPTEVGWWPGSQRPGSRHGHAVLVAHTVHTGGGAFDDLGRLRTGERITVSRGSSAIRYVVSRVAAVTPVRFAREASREFTRSGPPRLVLLTCSGWDGARYLATQVVTAVPASSSRTTAR